MTKPILMIGPMVHVESGSGWQWANERGELCRSLTCYHLDDALMYRREFRRAISRTHHVLTTDDAAAFEAFQAEMQELHRLRQKADGQEAA